MAKGEVASIADTRKIAAQVQALLSEGKKNAQLEMNIQLQRANWVPKAEVSVVMMPPYKATLDTAPGTASPVESVLQPQRPATDSIVKAVV